MYNNHRYERVSSMDRPRSSSATRIMPVPLPRPYPFQGNPISRSRADSQGSVRCISPGHDTSRQESTEGHNRNPITKKIVFSFLPCEQYEVQK